MPKAPKSRDSQGICLSRRSAIQSDFGQFHRVWAAGCGCCPISAPHAGRFAGHLLGGANRHPTADLLLQNDWAPRPRRLLRRKAGATGRADATTAPRRKAGASRGAGRTSGFRPEQASDAGVPRRPLSRSCDSLRRPRRIGAGRRRFSSQSASLRPRKTAKPRSGSIVGSVIPTAANQRRTSWPLGGTG